MLDHKVTIYVPSTHSVRETAHTLQAVFTDAALARLAGWFGGASVTTATGAWVAADGRLVKEAINLVWAFTDAEGLAAHTHGVLGLAREIAREMTQEAVAVEIDGSLQFVSPVAVETKAVA